MNLRPREPFRQQPEGEPGDAGTSNKSLSSYNGDDDTHLVPQGGVANTAGHTKPPGTGAGTSTALGSLEFELPRKHLAPQLGQAPRDQGHDSQTSLCPFRLPDTGLTHRKCTGNVYGPGKYTLRKEQRMEAETATTPHRAGYNSKKGKIAQIPTIYRGLLIHFKVHLFKGTLRTQ